MGIRRSLGIFKTMFFTLFDEAIAAAITMLRKSPTEIRKPILF